MSREKSPRPHEILYQNAYTIAKGAVVLVKPAIIIFLAYSGILALVYAKQDGMVYFPSSEIASTPAVVGMPYEDVSLTTADGLTLHAWYIPHPGDRGTLLFCHGNGGNISHRLESVKIFHDMGLNVLIFDYRGYGASDGRPTEKGTYLDVEAAWAFLALSKGIDPQRIILFGRSLGGAVAAYAAAKEPPAALILESTFTSVPDLGSKLYPWLPVRLISRYSYDTEARMAAISCPKLIIHSPDDDLVPFEHGRRLFQVAPDPKEFLEIRGDHNRGFMLSRDVYVDGLKRFFDRHLPPP